MNVELKVFFRVVGVTILLMAYGALLYRFFSVPGIDIGLIAWFILLIFPFFYVMSGFDNDLRSFYKRHPKKGK